MVPHSSSRSLRARAAAAALALVAADVIAISADLLRHAGRLQDVRFAVTTEGGYGEWLQYGKAAALALMLAAAHRRARAALAWAALFAYLLLDDAFALHERLGSAAASVLPLPAFGAMRPEHVGEVLVLGAIGAAFLAVLVPVMWREAASRRLTAALVPPFAALVLFGVLGDVVHSLSRGGRFHYAAGVIEDGGEMIALSLLVAAAYWATHRE